MSGSTATRRWDGKPETPAERRFFDLRASGYTGPVDQDGHAVARHLGTEDLGSDDTTGDR
ncbi:MAG: hypothetical protein HOY78_04385 [Saccharothrix sp.]|nr:hypothetical protein [Saccharothrix sp.]